MMAGKTLVGGVAYDVNVGKAIVGGTEYGIAEGMTMIGGTAYQIGRSQATPTLVELFTGASIVTTQGRNSSSMASLYISSTNVPNDATVYLFVMHNGNLGIWKIVNRVVSSTPIFQSNQNDCAIYNYNNNARWYYNTQYQTGSSTRTVGTAYGCTMAAIRFTADENTVDAILSSAGLTILGRRDSSSSSTVRATQANCRLCDVQLCGRSTAFCIYATNGSNLVLLISTSTVPGTLSGDYLTIGPVYGGSIVGLSKT